jgi:hypothetical protein
MNVQANKNQTEDRSYRGQWVLQTSAEYDISFLGLALQSLN